MTRANWVRVLDQAAAMRVEMVQFIGGEPTLHPDLPQLIEHALVHGLDVEVFSNLVHVTDALWEVFARPGVSLATSYYSAIPASTRRSPGDLATPARSPTSPRRCGAAFRCGPG